MQQPTSRQLYAYWDRVRNGRVAPRRFEIEPARIPALLPETFIAEGAGLLGFRFRLAGTKICEQFGKELRDIDLLSLFGDGDREQLGAMLHAVFTDGAVGHGSFRSFTGTGKRPSSSSFCPSSIPVRRSIDCSASSPPSSRRFGSAGSTAPPRDRRIALALA